MKSQYKRRVTSYELRVTKEQKVNLERSPRVFVGLSGGVDSAVSAALLQNEGYDVTGVFIKAWSPEGYPCTWREDRRSAMRVAAILNIPFITLDLEKEYKKEVVDYMISEYKKGRTPNPDVMCNKEIKFGHFLKFALENGADFIATGHYARVACEFPISNFPFPKNKNSKIENLIKTENFKLKISTDLQKDQSYFLWTLTQAELKHTLFPVGHLEKSEVRKLAGKFGLPQESRKDSQGLCFLGKIDMKEFLRDYIKPQKGDVLLATKSSIGGRCEAEDKKGKVIGYHDGAFFFTIGERHGFTITKNSPNSKPLYVVSKDLSKNTITVADKINLEKTKEKILPKEILIEDVNWISGYPDFSKKYKGRIRYRQELIGCSLSKSNEGVKVIFDKPELGVSSGQSLVVYGGEVCLGGGVIKIQNSKL
jgi:tRNA-uridine 2-sulfurtransferase